MLKKRLSPVLAGFHGLFLPILIYAILQASVAFASDNRRFVSESPLQRVEYWQQREQAINATLQDRAALASVKLVFLGDSITDFWQIDENPWVRGQRFGRASWQPSFGAGLPENRALNMGISGDRTEHVLYRILPSAQGGLGQLDAPELNPEFIILMIGINNTWAQEDPVVDSVLAGITSVLQAAHARKPKARIILQSLLPTNDAVRNRDVVLPVNTRIAALARRQPYADYTVFLNLYPLFTDSSGGQKTEFFVSDGVHPNSEGYQAWSGRLLAYLQEQRRQ